MKTIDVVSTKSTRVLAVLAVIGLVASGAQAQRPTATGAACKNLMCCSGTMLWDSGASQSFLARAHISTKVACHECFARPLCSGGCYHEAYVRYKDPTLPNLHYCEWIRAWTDLGLQTYARIMNAHPGFFEKFESRKEAPAKRVEAGSERYEEV